MKRFQYIFILSFLIFSVGSTGAESEVKVTGVYSNMWQHKETGDVIGREVFIVGARGKYYALVQFAEGEADKPQLVEVEVTGRKIEFTANFLGVQKTKFTGEVTKEGLEGKFEGLGEKVKLPRKKSFWQ